MAVTPTKSRRDTAVLIAVITLVLIWFFKLTGSPFTATPAQPATSHVPSVALNMTKVATIIETRAVPHLIPLLASFLTIVPQDWPFVVWTSSENHQMLVQAKVFHPEIASGRLNFTKVDMSSYKAGSDTKTLSEFLAGNSYFWDSFHPDAEWMLFFQSDSCLCSKSNQSVDDWIGFDWVGGLTSWVDDKGNGHGGNGGLSMRKISSMRAITSKKPRPVTAEPEDVWFVNNLDDPTLVPNPRWPADEGICQGLFSSSQGWIDKSSKDNLKPLGIHSNFIVGDLLGWCPEQNFMLMH